MKKSDKCKIVQDFLPNYIEKLTSNETNNYIECHLKECDECTKILKDMGEDIVLDKIDEIKKLDYLKKIKYRNRAIIGVIIGILVTIIIIPIIIISTVWFSYGGVNLDSNGNPEYLEMLEKLITGKSKIRTSRITNIILKNTTFDTSITKEGELKTTIVLTFDEKDICIGARYCLEGYTHEEALKRYNNFENIEHEEIPTITNVRMEDDKIIYNYSYWNGKTKEDVQKELSESYSNHIIEEI